MAETETGEFTFSLGQLTERLIVDREHPRDSGEYDFSNGLHIRLDESRRKTARTALVTSCEDVAADIGTDSLEPAHWGNVLSVLSFPTLVRIAVDSDLIEQ